MVERELTVSGDIRDQKIIILGLSGIGDALMFSPALELLRKRYPAARIDFLSMFKGVEELFLGNRDLTGVLYRDFLHANPFSSFFYLLNLRRRRYDVSINVYPSNRWHYNIISAIIGARKRLGHDYNHANTRSLNFLNNLRVHEDDRRHNVEENVRLIGLLEGEPGAPDGSVRALPGLNVVLGEQDKQFAHSWLKEHGIPVQSLIVGFHAGSSSMKNHERRRWAPEKFAQLGASLVDQSGATVLLFGGPDEYGLNRSINQMMAGKGICVEAPSLMKSVALMSHCSVFVSNDSGLMHVAAGLQIPTVAIFAYTNPAYVHPWQTPSIVVRRDLECSPCFFYSPRSAHCKWTEDRFRCITHIEADEIFQAVGKLVKETTNR